VLRYTYIACLVRSKNNWARCGQNWALVFM
jgi:hypothetical protein